jgi:hypothetical protein
VLVIRRGLAWPAVRTGSDGRGKLTGRRGKPARWTSIGVSTADSEFFREPREPRDAHVNEEERHADVSEEETLDG